jgi:putative FmdB family regulatory protein
MRYQYVCKDCGSEFDVEGSFDNVFSNVSCPGCNSMNTRKKFTMPGVIYKVKGFYSKDNSK